MLLQRSIYQLLNRNPIDWIRNYNNDNHLNNTKRIVRAWKKSSVIHSFLTLADKSIKKCEIHY